MNYETKPKIVGNIYYMDPLELADSNDGIKKRRPVYILSSINNEYVFAVISTTQKHSGRKNTYQNKKYIDWLETSHLRLDLLNGWTTISKESVIANKKYLEHKGDLNLSEQDILTLKKFYSSSIKDERDRLTKVA